MGFKITGIKCKMRVQLYLLFIQIILLSTAQLSHEMKMGSTYDLDNGIGEVYSDENGQNTELKNTKDHLTKQDDSYYFNDYNDQNNEIEEDYSEDTTTQKTTEDLSNDGLNSRFCGISHRPRIIGGDVVQPGQYPWMAAIMKVNKQKPFCGGAIIAKQFIITAAHCLYNEKPNQVTIRLGAHQFKGQIEPESLDYQIEKWQLHEEYQHRTYLNDIALIKLNSKIEYKFTIKPICLTPKESPDFIGKNVTVAGWGKIDYDHYHSSEVLRHVNLKAWSNEDCQQAHFYTHTKINQNMICASAKGKDSCQGDSGGPLMIKNKKRWTLIGLVSFGQHCADEEHPGINTRVNKYIDWIEEKIKIM